MGLFKFLKKNRSAPPSVSTTTDKPREQASVFKGDLAFVQDADTAPEKESSKTQTYYSGESEDSSDSVTYMSFAPEVRNVWVCPECGTRNENGFNGCIVCGLKK